MKLEEKQIKNMRHMAWERAKGELQSIKHTYWEVYFSDDSDKYKKFTEKLYDFIRDVEANGLIE